MTFYGDLKASHNKSNWEITGKRLTLVHDEKCVRLLFEGVEIPILDDSAWVRPSTSGTTSSTTPRPKTKNYKMAVHNFEILIDI